MRLLDANIAIYAAGKDHPYKIPCARLIVAIGDGLKGYTVDAEMLQEILHVYCARNERLRAFEMVERLLTLFPDPLPITKAEITAAKDLMRRYPALGARDAIHAAVVTTHKLEGIVSADRVFAGIPEVRWLDPADGRLPGATASSGDETIITGTTPCKGEYGSTVPGL